MLRPLQSIPKHKAEWHTFSLEDVFIPSDCAEAAIWLAASSQSVPLSLRASPENKVRNRYSASYTITACHCPSTSSAHLVWWRVQFNRHYSAPLLPGCFQSKTASRDIHSHIFLHELLTDSSFMQHLSLNTARDQPPCRGTRWAGR